jgi:hypothetical protein
MADDKTSPTSEMRSISAPAREATAWLEVGIGRDMGAGGGWRAPQRLPGMTMIPLVFRVWTVSAARFRYLRMRFQIPKRVMALP